MQNLMKSMSLSLPEDIMKKKWAGDIKGALAAIEARLQNPDLPPMLRDRLIVEKARIAILPTQYPFRRLQAEEKLRELVPNLTAEEFDDLENAGFIDFIYINGEKRYFVRAHRSAVKSVPALAARMGNKPRAENPFLDEMIAKLKQQGSLAKKICLRCVTSPSDEAFVAGETYLVHLPIPAACAQQRDIKVLDYDVAHAAIAPEDAPQRTIAFEERLSLNESFQVTYEYVQEIQYVDPLEPSGRTVPVYPNALPLTSEDTAEQAPHIMFTPYLRSLAKEIQGSEQSPVGIARKIYDFVTTKITYAFVRDYMQIDNPGEFCAINLKGDCGLQALLFIVLCRICGIPARWQSGLVIGKDDVGSHDWAQFYAAPYGWLFCDCSFGGGAWRAGNEERWNFYFGNLEPMRMVANRIFGGPITPEKHFLRADPYDNQAGEIECETRSFSFREAYADTTVIDVGDA